MSDGLRLRARHIRSITDGEFTPSPPPLLLPKLTDELLVIASDVVEAVGAEDKALARNGVFRLLAWTVADARGATVALDKALALTVGRRLISRADTVRGELAAAAAQAQEARAGELGDGELAAIDDDGAGGNSKGTRRGVHRLLGAGRAAARCAGS